LKDFKKFITENYKTIGSVVVVAAMLIACIATIIQKRTANTEVMAKMISITPLYENNINEPAFNRMSYYASGISGADETQVGIRDEVGAYSDAKELTDEQAKNKFALESLLASNTRDDTAASEARRRRSKYTLNNTTNVGSGVTVTISNNSSGSTGGTAQYANNSDGTYLGQFLLTGYCPCVICCGKTDKVTASGAIATSNHTIAADSRYSFGTKMIILGQVYTVEDRGGAIQGNHIDVYFDTHAEALQFGKKYADVYLYTGSDTSSSSSTSSASSSSDSSSDSSSESSSSSITVIGDSFAAGASSSISGASVDAQAGRSASDVLGIVNSLKVSGTLGDKVVIALGALESLSSSEGQNLIDCIGTSRKIYWVNSYAPGISGYEEVNATISSLASSNSNVTLIDWCSVGQAHSEYFSSDGTSLTGEGSSAFANTMASAVK
jgi:3D (Asp-Asp-Asp) domain-containing protein